MRLISLIFLALVLLIQYPLWFGRGGWFKVHDMDLQLQAIQKSNAELRARNDKLAAEVKDLREGAGALEERARYELGMIRDGEVFVQIVDPAQAAPATTAQSISPSDASPSAGQPSRGSADQLAGLGSTDARALPSVTRAKSPSTVLH
ncbi:MAG: cell division protein FtsB [Burkholderiaceae bacterium]|jgi:cell division protein FtsB